MEEIRKYPVGMQTFSKIREGNYVYVDKTKYIVHMLENGSQYVFLSRPRRFGKSLFVSTLQAYYEGRKELFEGLALGDYEKNWVKHPVLHFDMSTAKHMDPAGLVNELEGKLCQLENIYGTEDWAKGTNQRLECLVKRAYAQTGQKVVLLIDEYDAPLLDVVHEKENLKPLRQIMQNFYSPIKYLDPWLEFTFITGITKFSQFELDDFDDVSMSDQYSVLCGISEDELLTTMKLDVETLARQLGKSFDAMFEDLKIYYGGYHFGENSEEILCPFSLLKAFEQQKLAVDSFSSDYFDDFIKSFGEHNVDICNIEKKKLAKDNFCESLDQMLTATPVLYQKGYLTIKRFNSCLHCFHLGIPNKELKNHIQLMENIA